MTTLDPIPSFYGAWAAAMVAIEVAGDAPRHLGEAVMLDLGGVPFPLVTGVVAALGVLLARPLAPRRNPPLGLVKSACVTLLMMALALIWVAESQPRLLFAFVVSIGLGFSGYALIELAGSEVVAFVRRMVAAATGRNLDSGPESEKQP